MSRVTVTLNPDERSALIALAQRERRDPRDQAAIVIRRALESAGLLPAEDLKTALALEPARVSP